MSGHEQHERREEIKLLRELLETAEEQLVALQEILQVLRRPILTFARVTIMPKTVPVGGTANAVIQGLDQNGQPFVLDATYKVAYQSSTPADESFSPVNADGSDTIAALAASPAAGDQISATITRPDGVVISATPDVLTITAATPVLTSASVVLS
jgi:hypothetical protein